MEANPNPIDVVDNANNNIKTIKSIIGSEYPDSDILKALSQCGNNPDAAVNRLLDTSPSISVKSTKTSTGARVSTHVKQQEMAEEEEESDDVKSVPGDNPNRKENEGEGERGNNCCLDNSVEKSKPRMSFDEFLVATNTKVLSKEECLDSLIEKEMPDKWVKVEPEIDSIEDVKVMSKEESLGTLAEKENPSVRVKVEPVIESDVKVDVKVKEEVPDMGYVKDNVFVKEEKKESFGAKLEREYQEYLREKGIKFVEPSIPKEHEKPKLVQPISSIPPSYTCNVAQEPKMVQPISSRPPSSACKVPQEPILVQPISSRPPSGYDSLKPRNAKKPKVEDTRLNTVVIEDGDFPEEPDWLLVGRTTITGLSTTKGRKLEDNEIVHFAFPSWESRNRSSAPWVSAKAANAASSIVRFSTKRSGEIGRLPMEWAKCLVPLVNSKKVKVYGRCIAAPTSLCLMQEIMLYISFYIHHSVFTDCETASWKLDAPSNIDSTIYPLLTLFNLLKINPFQRADFTPEELDSRKRGLNLDGDSNEAVAVLPMTKRRKGNEAFPEQGKDEQVLTESSLNKLVGAVDMYNLEEMDPPGNLMCDLRPYQKQALYWMSELEKGVDDEKTTKTLHPCWSAYRICDERATSIYVNNFSGEATTKFPTATQMARGGILADAMGLGKTVMTIALILSRPGKGSPDDNAVPDDAVATEYIKKRKQDFDSKASQRVKGGTLIICPMALLGQWKDEIENHSKPESISVSVFYGGERSNNPKVIAEPDVVLTTYGVLSASYKADSENSIFHKIEWHRVVLDEAHTIKSSKAQVAQAAFALSAYCRWCLTGTPLQNNLEDLYSLLCFLHVEPWCNWAWWQKLIQRPYENGDQRGLKLIKAILRPLMLRRTKDTKDKEGRPILVLPPTDIQVIECEQSEAEHDFYDALFKRSKVQFDQFVAQGKVLHNYANILELLLRLRQCCNHPFLVMSRGDSQEFANLNNLAKRFLEPNPDSATPNQKVPSKAYVEEVVEGIRRGENTECPICLESADDPVLTPCAHRMCRDCLLSSWRTPAAGICPICRQVLKKMDLITCPSDSKFRIDVEKNWKESSKVSKLLESLQGIRKKGSGEKSIVFSQWTSFLDLLEIPLKRKKIEFLRFDGRLSQKNREKVLKEFSETRDKTVMLMSLKVGGVGLNLTSASNVFLMDPWWNPAVEEQAIMRIHRIGQKRTVCVRRFIVKDTVEERMQQVQARKQRMIAGALTDDEVRSARLEELKMLFR